MFLGVLLNTEKNIWQITVFDSLLDKIAKSVIDFSQCCVSILARSIEELHPVHDRLAWLIYLIWLQRHANTPIIHYSLHTVH